MKFYTYRQNNSGGYWDLDPEKGIGHYVIIEALDHNDADDRAERIGIEFGTGCPCCGDRWDNSYHGDENDSPKIYGEEPVEMFKESYNKDHLIYIHYADGIFVQVVKGQPND